MSRRTLLRLCAALALSGPGPDTARAQAAAEEAVQPTIITSDGPLTMKNDGVEAYFVFTDNVRLTGTNLEVTCDKLEIFVVQKEGGSLRQPRDASIRRILATGHVQIRQEGRTGTAGQVEVLPLEDKVIMTGNPVVTDPAVTAAGERITLFRGKQEFMIENPRVETRSLPNLGFPQSHDEPAGAPGAGNPPDAESQPAPPAAPAPDADAGN